MECEAQAEGDDRFEQKDLICGGCSNKKRDQACVFNSFLKVVLKGVYSSHGCRYVAE